MPPRVQTAPIVPHIKLTPTHASRCTDCPHCTIHQTYPTHAPCTDNPPTVPYIKGQHVYCSFHYDSMDINRESIERCISDISTWMEGMTLKLNQDGININWYSAAISKMHQHVY